MLTGGGTGGHITPLLAVARELKQLNPACYIVYVGDRNGKFAHITDNQPDLDESYTVLAGKFRRYHRQSLIARLADIRTNMLNIRDFFYFIGGTIQSLVMIKRVRPDLIFIKGGFVGVPVGLAAAFWRVPFVTHDSDIMPGLANRIVGRWARLHATGMPATFYNYSKAKTRHVGVRVNEVYKPVDSQLQREYKADLNIAGHSKVLFITGGSLGSRQINKTVSDIAAGLLERFSDLTILHQVGKGNEGCYGDFSHERLRVLPFVSGMHKYSGAADVIVSRGGANTLAEFGVQGKACIVIPRSFLPGGHQVKNALYLEEQGAIISVADQTLAEDPKQLYKSISSLLQDQPKRAELAKKLQSISIPDAATKVAKVLLEIGKKSQK
ncbi:undecaprenyldiphospho-muramoylpentapeptide beta-N-acetylglucosaminyltransferase [soil metagenome]